MFNTKHAYIEDASGRPTMEGFPQMFTYGLEGYADDRIAERVLVDQHGHFSIEALVIPEVVRLLRN